MNNTYHTQLHYRALAIGGMLFCLATLPFWLTNWDITVAKYFYSPQSENPWPLGAAPFWRFLYYLVPVLSATIALGSLLIFAWSFLSARQRTWRIPAIYILLTFVLGPGLIVNGILKEHWGRPRPIQVDELGGVETYIPPLEYNAQGSGKSFPSGHSSIGFAMIAFWLLWRRQYPRLAPYLLWGSIAFGSLLGVTRMVAGGHFLSDVLWSALISWGVAWIVYFWLLRLPEYEAKPDFTLPVWQRWLYAILGVALVIWSLFTVPVELNVNQPYVATPHTRAWTLQLNHSDVQISLSDTLAPNTWTLWHESRGFGLLGSKVRLIENNTTDHQQLQLQSRGLFIELVGNSKIQIARQFTLPLQIQTQSGKVVLPNEPLPPNIQVTH